MCMDLRVVLGFYPDITTRIRCDNKRDIGEQRLTLTWFRNPTQIVSSSMGYRSPLILQSIQFAIEEGSFHRDQTLAIITLLLKKDNDPLDCSSFRPISLTCADIKMFAKVLVNRIEPSIDKLIHYDQTGFIKGRMASDKSKDITPYH